MWSPIAISFVCVSLAVFGSTASAPQQQQQRKEDGFGAVLWSVLDDCFGDFTSAVPATVCLKSKALTALDRALGKSAVTLTEGVTLTARAGKSLAVDPQADRADRAALDAAPDADSKNAMLDDMLASRMDRLMSTRTIVLDGVDQEGRKKKDKGIQQAIMMAGMTAAAVMGPMALKIIALISVKALLISKIALVLSGIIVLKKLIQPQQGGGGGHETESHQSHHYGRSIQLEDAAQNMAYSGQKQ
ncbi:uncharacterized protein LOC132935143 [Metopolophium dirhodum]|uniref:uncharacterized protein LOC132935143 n=1 Tax=Metopolophium dirhodum TaxID=44670 RepID=UPI002990406F|nr:uncharacterized protein LOC132935143 [Metopolophium dirhodum]